ncbi:type I-F CRISPR-associated protein Csy2 [Enterovibrio norvegicus]|uniref:type I-F CRISPR-associated protein Csy2 n=1 Tax=Enterovibrio norvegicus TaxID=188144 RepID=UPI0024B108A3|nr:type I-F CRISPR-associated protein Csy2 [Enterovibrio norvegicus]
METLQSLLSEENLKARNALIKKAFMPYTAPICVDGAEKQTALILLNLALLNAKCENYLDPKTAKQYLKNDDNICRSLNEISWFHTHNLKYPDCRVKDQKVLSLLPSQYANLVSNYASTIEFGWAHDSKEYKHCLWLLSSFVWQGEITSLLNLMIENDPTWMPLLAKLGLTKKKASLFKKTLEEALSQSSFPESVHPLSKRLRFPWKGEEVTITPVMNHGFQMALERYVRSPECRFNTTTQLLPNSPSIGSLAGALGGHMRLLNYPLSVRPHSKRTLSSSWERTHRFFDDFAMMNKKTCGLLRRLSGESALSTPKKQMQVRRYQIRALRRQIGVWLMPLVELRDHIEESGDDFATEDALVQAFVFNDLSELETLASGLNQQLQLTLQESKFGWRYAYHQKLMPLMKRQLRWILRRLIQSQDGTEATHDEQYIYLSRMRVFDASMMGSPYLAGSPSLTAIWGFMHAYQRQFIELLDADQDCLFESFAIFFRSESRHYTAKLTELSKPLHKRNVSPIKRTTLRSEHVADLEFNMVIKVKSEVRISDYAKALKAALPFNFAGGGLFPPELDISRNWLSTYPERSSLFHRISRLPSSGCWLIPAKERPQTLPELDACLSADHTQLPLQCGYAFLENPKARFNSLTKHHCYADNVIGLGKRLNPVEVRWGKQDNFFRLAFWTLTENDAAILIEGVKED